MPANEYAHKTRFRSICCHFEAVLYITKYFVYKTHTVLETLLYRVFGTSSDDTHASSFWIAMAVGTFPAVVWLVGWSAKHFVECWSGCNWIWCSASNMLPPPEKCQPTNTLTKHDFVPFLTFWSCIIHYKILVYKTHTVLETLLYRVFGTSSDDTHASSFWIAMAVGTFPAVVWLVGWSAKHFVECWSGCNWIWCSASNMLPPPICCHHQRNASQRIRSWNTVSCRFWHF